MKTTIGFRKAIQADIGFLVELRKQSMTEHLAKAGIHMSDVQHLQRITEYFDDSHLILKDNQIIGLLKLGVLPLSFHIRQLQILPEFHGFGIGSKVLELVKKKAEEANLAITLNVLLKNPAKNLYLRQGFVVVGENELEYQMRWQIKNA